MNVSYHETCGLMLLMFMWTLFPASDINRSYESHEISGLYIYRPPERSWKNFHGGKCGFNKEHHLFNSLHILKEVFRNLKWEETEIKINGEKLRLLRFADDVFIFNWNQRKILENGWRIYEEK